MDEHVSAPGRRANLWLPALAVALLGVVAAVAFYRVIYGSVAEIGRASCRERVWIPV